MFKNSWLASAPSARKRKISRPSPNCAFPPLKKITLSVFLGLAVVSGFFPAAMAGEPSPTPQASPSPAAVSATPRPKATPDEEEQEIRRNHRFLGEPARPARTTMFIGREVAVPTGYNAPRITTSPGGAQVIQPATPHSFETRKTGVMLGPDGGFEQTELEGFINYGTPIRTIVPIYNEKGEFLGTAIQEHPNNILQPVFRTIRR